MYPLKLTRSLIAVGIVCVNYADFLRHTLAQTLRHFSDVTVISDEQDCDTIRLAQSMGVKVFLSTLWFRDGAAFNKSAALNEWLSLRPLTWTLILDADIYLPDTFTLDCADLNPQYLYSIPRRMCEEEWDWVCPTIQRPEYPLAIPPVRNGMVWRRPTTQPAALSGYFHLWNRATSGKALFPPSSTAAEYDVEFALQFPEQMRLYLPGDVIHLGLAKQNWSGRVSPRWTLLPEDPQLIPAYLLPYGVDKIYRFGIGSRNPTFLCMSPTRAWVYRTVPQGCEWQLTKEIYVQETLKFVPTPKVLDVSETSCIMEYGGRTAQTIPNLPDSFFASCGIVLRRLHEETLDIPKLCQKRYAKANWDALFGFHYRIGQCTRWLERMPSSSPLIPTLTVLLDRMQNDSGVRDAFHASTFCFTHGDYKTGNILTDGLNVTSVIDFEHAIYGDPDSDLHWFCQRVLDEGYPVGSLRAFLSAYGVSATFYQKQRFYRYFHAFQRSLLSLTRKDSPSLYQWLQTVHDHGDLYLRCDLA